MPLDLFAPGTGATLALFGARVSGLVLVAPVFSSRTLPPMVKAGLVVVRARVPPAVRHSMYSAAGALSRRRKASHPAIIARARSSSFVRPVQPRNSGRSSAACCEYSSSCIFVKSAIENGAPADSRSVTRMMRHDGAALLNMTGG